MGSSREHFGEDRLAQGQAGARLEHSLESWDSRIPTGRLNAFLGEIVAAHPHPLRGGKQPRILFGTQVSSRPPKFVLFTTGFLDPGYRRFIMRRLRETFDFTGTPIEISMRVRERRSLGERQSAKAKKGKSGRPLVAGCLLDAVLLGWPLARLALVRFGPRALDSVRKICKEIREEKIF